MYNKGWSTSKYYCAVGTKRQKIRGRFWDTYKKEMMKYMPERGVRDGWDFTRVVQVW